MLYPSINDLLNKADSRYCLVNEVSKRARQLVEGSDKMVDTVEEKPVSVSRLSGKQKFSHREFWINRVYLSGKRIR